MNCVVDASVACKWFFKEDLSVEALMCVISPPRASATATP